MALPLTHRVSEIHRWTGLSLDRTLDLEEIVLLRRGWVEGPRVGRLALSILVGVGGLLGELRIGRAVRWLLSISRFGGLSRQPLGHVFVGSFLLSLPLLFLEVIHGDIYSLIFRNRKFV